MTGKRPPPAKKTVPGSRLASAKGKGSPTKSLNLTAQKSSAGGAADYQPVQPAAVDDTGIGGSGEEMAQTLEKIVSQLDIISRTMNVLEQRVSKNEEAVTNVKQYFSLYKQQ